MQPTSTCFSLPLVVALSLSGAAQIAARYDAALGTPPDAQGWTHAATQPATVQVAGSVLSLDTTPFCNPSCTSMPQPQYCYWQVNPPAFDFANGVAFEIDMQIVTSEYGTNPCNGWLRPGFGFSIGDQSGHTYWVGFGNGMVFLANDPYATASAAGVVATGFNTTNTSHVYRLEIAGSTAVLRAGGVVLLSLTGVGNPSTPNTVWVGDGTVWANANVDIRRFGIEGGLCVSRNGSGINPPDFSCVTEPRIGSVWTTSFAAGTNTVATVLALAQAGVPASIPLFGGELLVAVAPAPLLVVGSGSIATPLPNSPQLVGLQMATQGARLDLGPAGVQIVLLNAIDITVGG